MEVKIVKLAPDDWGVRLSPELTVSGFPTLDDAGKWYADFIVRMLSAKAADETRSKFLGAALLGSLIGKKTS